MVIVSPPGDVAPYTGAWIETPVVRYEYDIKVKVAPYTGAWIETMFRNLFLSANAVAPYTGAWIETFYPMKPIEFGNTSHLTQVRGLKLAQQSYRGNPQQVAPYTGAWIETWMELMVLLSRLSVAPYTGAWIET